MRESAFYLQADLLLQVLPFVHEEECFALKGGTALNFFIRDFPRLSVDIDLVYLPLEDRPATLQGIEAGLERIARKVERALGANVRRQRLKEGNQVHKLFIRGINGAEIKVEPNLIIRGALFPAADLMLATAAQEFFQRAVRMRVLSLAELYGGKICAALDRQHPRDLFDVHWMLRNEGITDDIRRAFVVFLGSHDRPMNELLTPNRKELAGVYASQFEGMAREEVSLHELERAREELIHKINGDLRPNERSFLLSIKRLEPEWEVLGLPNLDEFPGIKWKLYNLRKMKEDKRLAPERLLRSKLGL